MPDGGQYGPNLATVENMLPVFGSWRPLQQKSALSSVAGGPVTGAYVHIYQQAAAIQFMRPDSDDSVGAWLTSIGSGSLYQQIDEVQADDADFIFATNAPTAVVCKVGLSNPAAAAGGVNNFFRWRHRIPYYVSGTWELKCELMQDTTVISTDTASGTAAVTAWTQRQKNLSAPEIAAITNYNNLFFRFTATVAGSAQFARPTSDISVGSWLTQAGGSSNLYQTIDEVGASDADFITTPGLTAGGTSYTYTAGLGAIVDPLMDTGFTWRYRYRGTNAGVTLVARLKQGSTIIKETTHSSIGTSFATQATGLSAGEVATITDFAALRTEFVASYPTGVASTVAQLARPTSDVDNSHGWQNSAAGTTNLYQEIDEVSADDGTSVILSYTTIGGDVDTEYIAGLGTVLDPLVSSGHIVRFRWKRASTGSATISVFLYQGASLIATVADHLNKPSTDNAWTTATYTLSAAEADAITDYSQLRLVFRQPGLFVATEIFYVTWAEVEVPQPRKAEVSWAELEGPSHMRAEVSWSEFEVPDASTTYRGDIPTIIAGTKTKLYEVTQSSWTDISKVGGYAGGTSYPSSWSMCSFGNHVIATNYVDPVQYRANNAGLFADLITSVELPKARFCVPWKEALLLGGISLAGHYDDELWWSSFTDIRDFHPAISTLCDSTRLTACPGQIMGLVGGDFALAFKRRSIHALDFVGGLAIARVRDVSSSVGTPFPHSIIAAESGIYFWGGRSFYFTDGYIAPVPIGDDVVARYLTDSAFQANALQAYTPTSISEEDQLMVGWYDPAAGLCIWHYMATGNAISRHTRAIAYSPSEKRWSTIYVPSHQIAYACQRGNVTGAESFLLKGTVGFGWDGTTSDYFRFSDASTYAGTFTTKRQAIALDEHERPMSVRIQGVLPVMTSEPLTGTWPNLTVTVSAANDVQFLVEVHAETYSSADAKEAGWLPHDVAGTWVTISVSVPSMSARTLAAFKGVYVHWTLAGRS